MTISINTLAALLTLAASLGVLAGSVYLLVQVRKLERLMRRDK